MRWFDESLIGPIKVKREGVARNCSLARERSQVSRSSLAKPLRLNPRLILHFFPALSYWLTQGLRKLDQLSRRKEAFVWTLGVDSVKKGTFPADQ